MNYGLVSFQTKPVFTESKTNLSFLGKSVAMQQHFEQFGENKKD